MYVAYIDPLYMYEICLLGRAIVRHMSVPARRAIFSSRLRLARAAFGSNEDMMSLSLKTLRNSKCLRTSRKRERWRDPRRERAKLRERAAYMLYAPTSSY